MKICVISVSFPKISVFCVVTTLFHAQVFPAQNPCDLVRFSAIWRNAVSHVAAGGQVTKAAVYSDVCDMPTSLIEIVPVVFLAGAAFY